MVTTTQQDWILTALSKGPLDRLRLMKAVFLAWDEVGRPDVWQFTPYLYGPYTVHLYGVLEQLAAARLVFQPDPMIPSRSVYRLTAAGETEAQAAGLRLQPTVVAALTKWTDFARQRSFDQLLRYVYKRFPEFASKSIAAIPGVAS
jgi:uncharacterized protein